MISPNCVVSRVDEAITVAVGRLHSRRAKCRLPKQIVTAIDKVGAPVAAAVRRIMEGWILYVSLSCSFTYTTFIAAGYDSCALMRSGKISRSTATLVSAAPPFVAILSALPGLVGSANTFLQGQNTFNGASATLVNATSTNPFQSTCPPS